MELIKAENISDNNAPLEVHLRWNGMEWVYANEWLLHRIEKGILISWNFNLIMRWDTMQSYVDLFPNAIC